MEVIHTILVYLALWWGCIVNLAGAQTMFVPEYNNLVQRGKDVTLLCYFPSNMWSSNCQWYFTRNESVERLLNGTRYTWSCSPKVNNPNYVHIQLLFKNATFTDSGKYICETTAATGKVRGELPLNVYAKPQITVPKTNYKSVVGTDVTLECMVNASGETNISIGWQNMFLLQWNNVTNSNKYYWTTHIPSLVISEVMTTDSGFYRCFASTPLVTVVGLLISLQVLDRPLVTVRQTQFFIASGEDVVLNCIVDGRGLPIINVIWYKQSQALQGPQPNNTKYRWRQQGPDASIRITKATETDAGIYVCEGRTEAGSSKGGDIELRVGYKPTVTVNEYNYYIGKGDNLTVHCSIDGHGSTVKIVEWLKQENSQFRYLQSSTRVFWDISSPSLKIINVSLDDAGNYTCKGMTEFGMAKSQQISVQVFYLLVINQQDIKDLNGSSLKKYVVPGVSVVACLALIALIVVVKLIRTKLLKDRADKPNSGIRRTNEQRQPLPSGNISSGNTYEQLCFHQSEDLTYTQVIRQSNTYINGSNITGDDDTSPARAVIDNTSPTVKPESSTQIPKITFPREMKHTRYMNINNIYAAVQQRSSTSNSNSCSRREESENKQYMNINNTYAAVQQRSTTSNLNSCSRREESEKKQGNRPEELN